MAIKKANNVIEEKTYFEVVVTLEGEEVVPFGEGFITVADSENLNKKNEIGNADFDLNVSEKEEPAKDVKIYNSTEVVFITNNDKTREFFKKYTPRLFQFRGIKNTDDINENDPTVREQIEKSIQRKQQRSGKNRRRISITPSEKSAIITGVRRVHEPHANLAFSQMVLLSMLRFDLFQVRGKQIDTKFEIDIPDEYWKGAKPEETDDLDALLSDYTVIEPFFDSENPLEYMLAYTSVFLEKYPKLSDYITKNLVKKAYVALSFEVGGVETDDITFLENRLDELLA